MNSITRLDWLTRLYFYGDIPSDTRISRGPERVKFRTTAVLLLLLVAIPIFDTLLVALSLSRTSHLTFEEAGFRGVQLGVDEEMRVVETIPYVSLCRSAKFEDRPGDLVTAVFQVCETPTLVEEKASNISGFDISLERQSHVYVRVNFQGSVVFGAVWTQLSGVGIEKNLKASITNESLTHLVETALDGFAMYCGEGTTSQLLGVPQSDELGANNMLIASVRILCQNATIPKPDRFRYAAELVDMLRKKFTFIESEGTLARDITDMGSDFVEQANGVLLQRTERNSSLFTLIIVLVALVLLRVTLRTLSANDVEAGLEQLFLSRLGFTVGSTTVWGAEGRVFFRKKYQDGDCCQLGMEREDMTEVENFQGGVVGEVYENSTGECLWDKWLH
ncbi:hypothetical protein FGB62_136g05 [Gracilaria domingensis]|nr:hypothetical protein FGB62_136g05 [Gracilaria domingensis]